MGKKLDELLKSGATLYGRVSIGADEEIALISGTVDQSITWLVEDDEFRVGMPIQKLRELKAAIEVAIASQEARLDRLGKDPDAAPAFCHEFGTNAWHRIVAPDGTQGEWVGYKSIAILDYCGERYFAVTGYHAAPQHGGLDDGIVYRLRPVLTVSRDRSDEGLPRRMKKDPTEEEQACIDAEQAHR